MLLSPSEKNVPLDDDVYDALFSILSGTRTFTDWPKNSEGSLRQRVYRKWKTNWYEVKEIHDPIAGCLTKRITDTGHRIVWLHENQKSRK